MTRFVNFLEIILSLLDQLQLPVAGALKEEKAETKKERNIIDRRIAILASKAWLVRMTIFSTWSLSALGMKAIFTSSIGWKSPAAQQDEAVARPYFAHMLLRLQTADERG